MVARRRHALYWLLPLLGYSRVEKLPEGAACHVKRFGDYLIDMKALPKPYEIDLALAM